MTKSHSCESQRTGFAVWIHVWYIFVNIVNKYCLCMHCRRPARVYTYLSTFNLWIKVRDRRVHRIPSRFSELCQHQQKQSTAQSITMIENFSYRKISFDVTFSRKSLWSECPLDTGYKRTHILLRGQSKIIIIIKCEAKKTDKLQKCKCRILPSHPIMHSICK